MIPARRHRPARSGRRTGPSPAVRLRCRRRRATALGGRRLLRVVLRPRSWLNLLYLALSFPLGLFYFVVLVTLLAVGIGLVIIWVGIFILALTAAAWWAFASFERSLADGLLGTHLQPAPRPWQTANGTWPRIKAHSRHSPPGRTSPSSFQVPPRSRELLHRRRLRRALARLDRRAVLLRPRTVDRRRRGRHPRHRLRRLDRRSALASPAARAARCLLLIVSMHVFNGLAAVWRAIARGLLETAGEPRPQATAAGEAGRPPLAETQAPSWNPYSYPPPPAAQPQPPFQGWPSQPAQPPAGQPYPGQPSYASQPPFASQPPYAGQAPYPGQAPIRQAHRPIKASRRIHRRLRIPAGPMRRHPPTRHNRPTRRPPIHRSRTTRRSRPDPSSPPTRHRHPRRSRQPLPDPRPIDHDPPRRRRLGSRLRRGASGRRCTDRPRDPTRQQARARPRNPPATTTHPPRRNGHEPRPPL